MTVDQEKYIEIIVDFYSKTNKTISLEDLQVLYNKIYPDSKIKLNIEDWAISTLNMENKNIQKFCEYFEKINCRIDISKTSSLQFSEIFVNRLIQKLQSGNYQKELNGLIEPYCDKNHQGLMISFNNKIMNDSFYLWVSELENKEFMVLIAKEKNNQNLFMLEEFEKAHYFNKENFDEAISFSLSKIDKFLGKDLNMKI